MTGIEYLSIALLGEYDKSQTADEIFAQIEAETKELIKEGEGLLSVLGEDQITKLRLRVLNLEGWHAPRLHNWIGRLTVAGSQLKDRLASTKGCLEHITVAAKDRIVKVQSHKDILSYDKSMIGMLSAYKAELYHNIERAVQAFKMLDLGFKESEKKNA